MDKNTHRTKVKPSIRLEPKIPKSNKSKRSEHFFVKHNFVCSNIRLNPLAKYVFNVLNIQFC